MAKKRQRNKKKIILGIVIIIILIAIVVIQKPFQKKSAIAGDLQNNENTGLDVGSLAPDFILESIDGKKVQLSSFRGKKAVVVNFWATWCPPCREEFPAFEDVFQRNQDMLEIIGVNLQENTAAIDKFLEEIPVTFTLVLDPNKDVKERYNVFTQPVTYFVDENGIIADKKFGPLTDREIEDKFAKLGIN